MSARPALTVRNGLWHLSELVVIDAAGHRLQPAAAASLARMQADGCPRGNVTTAYRDRTEQARLLALYGYPHAEYPGKSRHGDGLAVDFPEPMRSWARAHGAAYGWIFPVKAESWHGEYVAGNDQHRDRVASPPRPAALPEPPAPARTYDEDDDVKILTCPTGWALVGAGHSTVLRNDYELETARQVYGRNGVPTGPEVALSADRLASAVELHRRMTVSRDVAASVWATPVKRDGRTIPALQEVADAKTIAARIETKVNSR